MRSDRPSATARLIAAATVMHETHPDPAARPPAGAAAWCETFLSTSWADRLLLASVRTRAGRAWWRWAEARALPGLSAHWMRRKHAIESLVLEARRELGAAQLVVLGAGLDTLAFRMKAQNAFDRVVVADHPATLRLVRAALDRHRVPHASSSSVAAFGNGEVALVPIDLTHDHAATVLRDCPVFDPALPTVVVAEGVLMYLPEPAVTALLAGLSALLNLRLRLIASWMDVPEGRPIGFGGQSRFVAGWLRRKGEPMKWSSQRPTLVTFLSGLGWSKSRILNVERSMGLARASPMPDRPIATERLVVADRTSTS